MFNRPTFMTERLPLLLLTLLLTACSDQSEKQAASDSPAADAAKPVKSDTDAPAPAVLPPSETLMVATQPGSAPDESIVPAPVPATQQPGQWVSLNAPEPATQPHSRARIWPAQQGELALTRWPHDKLAAFSILTGERGQGDSVLAVPPQVPIIHTVRDATHATIDWATFDSVLDAGSQNFRAWYVVDYRGLPQTAADEELRQVQARVESYRQSVWVGSPEDVSRYAQEFASARLENVENNPATVYFELKDNLDDRQFDQPLTVKVRLPEGWSGEATRATQAGIECPVSVVAHEGKTYALVDVIPDRGTVMVEF